jgi:NADPH-dependent 2,4-dienoyl-CoA reductase/sulfur reductase-like enzyme
MHIVIVGGSDAEISAALRIRELDRSAEVTVVLADAYLNYSICGLPFYLERYPNGLNRSGIPAPQASPPRRLVP